MRELSTGTSSRPMSGCAQQRRTGQRIRAMSSCSISAWPDRERFPNRPEVGCIVGTACYMSPEQAAGEPIDVRSDLFSLGCILYEMCSGRRAFDGPNLLAIMRDLALNCPPILTDIVKEVPYALAELIQQLLSKDRTARPISARAVIAVLTGLGQALANPEDLKRIELAGAGAAHVQPGAGPKAIGSESTRPAPDPFLGRRPKPPYRMAGMFASVTALAGVALLAFFLVGPGQNHGVNTGNESSSRPVSPPGEPVPVGVLHSLSGTMANSESAVVDATLFAIEEINKTGGVLGRRSRRLWWTASRIRRRSRAAERLLTKDKVVTVFGCWTSASRKTVKPIFEDHDSLLVYRCNTKGSKLRRTFCTWVQHPINRSYRRLSGLCALEEAFLSDRFRLRLPAPPTRCSRIGSNSSVRK